MCFEINENEEETGKEEIKEGMRKEFPVGFEINALTTTLF